MRILFVVMMSVFIFVCTCSSNFADLRDSGEVHFKWQGNPSFEELLLPWPSGADKNFAYQKAGHALAFFMLTGGLLSLIPQAYSAIIAAIYALATEFLQLYFMRSGLLLDVMVDCGGISLALLVYSLIKSAAGQSRQKKSMSQNK
ncbi:VanZ family protein [Bacillus infantis]|uniref:VanZ family protein n=1 Tax=Bacillus infantis TaxID=324767 RepID=UPI0030161763